MIKPVVCSSPLPVGDSKFILLGCENGFSVFDIEENSERNIASGIHNISRVGVAVGKVY